MKAILQLGGGPRQGRSGALRRCRSTSLRSESGVTAPLLQDGQSGVATTLTRVAVIRSRRSEVEGGRSKVGGDWSASGAHL
jgi:hypothetical protein